jgi:hypothetical protein
VTPDEKSKLVEQCIHSPEGRAKLARAMIDPIRKNLDKRYLEWQVDQLFPPRQLSDETILSHYRTKLLGLLNDNLVRVLKKKEGHR